jgi:hypothetical protein
LTPFTYVLNGIGNKEIGMPYTQEERKTLDETKVSFARRLEFPHRPWTQEQYLEVLKSNTTATPINASLMVDRGQYAAAKAMLSFTLQGIAEIEGLEAGTLEYRPGGGVYVVATGEEFKI